MKQAQNGFPQWYWTRGLHDAKIVSATATKSDWNDDNCLIIKIDGEGALGEANITEIRFYNYKFIINGFENYFDINTLNDGWWLSDELSRKGDHYYIDVKFETSKRKTRHMEMTFQRAEVDRE